MMGLISIRLQLLNVASVRLPHHPFTARRADTDGKRDQRSRAGERLQRIGVDLCGKDCLRSQPSLPSFSSTPGNLL
jgi:hypothetical protein